jgi:hypothetical protein
MLLRNREIDENKKNILRRNTSKPISTRRHTYRIGHVLEQPKGLFGRAPAPRKMALAPVPLVEWLLWWSWSCFEKRLAKRLHDLD